MRAFPLRSAAAFLAAASFAFPPVSLRAQAPGPLPGMTPPPLPAGMSPTGPGGRPSMAGDTVRLQFANTDVRDVLDNYYAPLVGKRIIYDNTLQGQLTVFINTPVARDEAVRILENNLMLNGFHLVQGENDIIRVLSGPKNPRFYGPPIYSDPAQIPDGDQVISFLIKPRYIDIAELNQVLGQYIQLQKPYTSFIALPKTGAILATEDSPTLRRLLPIVQELDVPPATVIDKFVKLERADAAKAVEFVNSVLGRDKSGTGGSAAPGAGGVVNTSAGGVQRRPIRRLNEEGQPVPDNTPLGFQPSPGLTNAIAALSEGNLTAGSVNIQADIRTNRVHIVARPADFPFLERLIREFDANTPFADPVRRSLRFVTATDMLPILVQSLQEQGAPDAGGQNGASNLNRNSNNNTTGNRNNNNSNNGGGFGSGSGSLGGNSSGSSNNLFGSGSSSDSSGTSTGGLGTSNLQTSQVSDQPQAAIVGTTRLIADPRTNSISILGGAEARDKVDRLLTLLDVPTPQVMIEVLIGELSLTNSEQFGINYLLRTGKNAQLTTNNTSLVLPGTTTTGTTGGTTTTDPVTGVVTTIPGTSTSATTAVNLASIAAQSVAGFGGVAGTLAISKYFATAITALENTGRFKTISRPIIFTSNNKAATILSGQEIAIASNQSSTLGSTTTSTAFRRVALQLDVVPLINSANAVTLDIVQQVNSIVAGSGTVVNGNSIPTIATRAVKSTVTVPNQGTVVLGGLITQSDNRNDGGVPLLNRIPIVGELFKTRTRDTPRNELIILLRPVITNTAEQLIKSRRDEENHLYLEPGLDKQLRPIPRAKPVDPTTTTVKVQTTTRREQPVVTAK